jgi:shikimate 5-dehydrogenase
MIGLEPARHRTMHFIGVSTGGSSIMRVFPAWSRELGLDADIHGIDLPPNDTRDHYRQVVAFLKADPNSLGALVTTHKINLYRACRDLFDGIGESTRMLEEVSSISKRGDELWGHALDPITSGLSLEAIAPDGYWTATDAELLLLGAGGSSLALTLYLHERAAAGRDVPRRLIVTNRSPRRLEEMHEVHERLGFRLPVEYVLAPEPSDNDRQVARLAPASIVINATGLGKDRPGSPVTDRVEFPDRGIVWEFNYRGDLEFLDQAKRRQADRDLRIEDGWRYFIHGWTRVIAEVFHIDIPTSGPTFDHLSATAAEASETGPR